MDNIEKKIEEYFLDKLKGIQEDINRLEMSKKNALEMLQTHHDLCGQVREKRARVYMDLWEKEIVSDHFICEYFGIDYEQERSRVLEQEEFRAKMEMIMRKREE